MPPSDDEFSDLIARAIARLDPTIERRLESDPQAHLDLVVLTNRASEEAGRLLRSAVASARSAGSSWETIGGALGMTRQAAQQRFGVKSVPTPEAPEHRQLVGLTAFSEIDRLNEWGRHGWHSVAYGPFFHDVEESGVQWEHRRAVVGSRTAHRLEEQGWERIGTMWFPWVYFKRSLDASAEPGEPV